jgi:hydrogenase expression/formation protein HypC
MCLAVPGRVLSIDGLNAKVDFAGVEMAVLADLLPDIAVGEYILVHAGFAIQRLDAGEAIEIIEQFKEIDDALGGGEPLL